MTAPSSDVPGYPDPDTTGDLQVLRAFGARVPNNPILALSASGVGAVLRKIKATIIEAAGRGNFWQQPPLLAPSTVTTGVTYYKGDVVAGTGGNAGNAYMAQVDAAASTTPASLTGTGPYAITDGGQIWTYYGSSAADPTSDVASLVIGAPDASATLIVNCVANNVPDTTKFNFIGGGASVTTPGGLQSVSMASTPVLGATISGVAGYEINLCGLDFMTDSDVVCVASSYAIGGTDYNKYRIRVDGKPLTKGVMHPTSPPGTFGMNVAFKGRKERRFTEYHGSNGVIPFQKVYIKPGSSIWAPSNPNRWNLVINGCSVDSQNFNASIPDGAYPTQVAGMLGCDSVCNIAVNGTGFTNTQISGTTVQTYDQRLATFFARGGIPCDVYMVGNPLNDNTSNTPGFTPELLQQAVLQHLINARAGFGPNVIMLLTGLQSGTGGPSAQTLANEAAMLAAFNQYKTAYPNDSFVAFIPVATDPAGPWVFGGKASQGSVAPVSGNSDYYMTAPNDPHPWILGHDYYARRYYQAIKNALLTLAAQAGV